MKGLLWLLTLLGILAFAVGTVLAFARAEWLLPAQGYWRGAMGFWLLAVTLAQITQRHP